MTSFFVCGDIVNYENGNGMVCSKQLEEVISSADYAVCNFEAPVDGFGDPQPKSGPHHHQRVETIGGLKSQGFDLLLLANNHMMDYGEKALAATLTIAEKAKIETIGAGLNAEYAYKPIVKEINGIIFGMINACEAQFGVIDYFDRKNNAGYAWINHTKIDKTIIQLREKCDFVIVFAHAGLEHYSIPQKEWRERYKYFCDLGVDVVFGSHPHQPQGFEKHGDSLIFYSLGNFYFDSKNYKDKEDQSFSVWLEFTKNKNLFFKPVFHYKKDGHVRIATPEKQVDLRDLSLMLEKKYAGLHDQMCLEAYEQIKRNLLFSLGTFPFDGTIKSSLRRIVSYICGRNKKIDKELLQLHLLRNEAYYFAAKHALELKTKIKYTKS